MALQERESESGYGVTVTEVAPSRGSREWSEGSVLMEPSDRIRLIEAAAQTLEEGWSKWSADRLNLVLRTFDLTPVPEGQSLSTAIREKLVDVEPGTVYAVTREICGPESVPQRLDRQAARSDVWSRDSSYVRVFLSHIADEKAAVMELSDKLALRGIDGFVAHEHIEVTAQWQESIESALRTMDAFVAIIQGDYHQRAWTNQEMGWAYGAGVPVYCVRQGADPRGFLAKTQWPTSSSVEGTTGLIVRWLAAQDLLNDRLTEKLIDELAAAQNYAAARDAANALNDMGQLTTAQLERIDNAYRDNSQVGGSVWANRALAPLYGRHQRPMPNR